MKLITEVLDVTHVLTEDSKGEKHFVIEGIFLQAEIANKNRRIYPSRILEREVNRYNEEYVKQNRALGELGHPDGPTVNLDRVSHMITSLKKEGNNFIGRAKILATPMGKIVESLLNGGAKLGVSSRGLGTLKEMDNGINEVQDDFFLSTAADIVADPSAPDAFVSGIMENKEWVLVNGIWTEQSLQKAQKTIRSTSKKDLEEAKFRVFSRFLHEISQR
jgi:hypothetical protein